jgi:hypothetical protein
VKSSIWEWNSTSLIKADLGLVMAKPNWVKGRDGVKKILQDNPELAEELEGKIKAEIMKGKQ